MKDHNEGNASTLENILERELAFIACFTGIAKNLSLKYHPWVNMGGNLPK